ncbi:hypothetical protein [Microvirga subterranea]|uniref:Uncharacterized protein n=1 Tax=Microvirga subterranea TaxID=186651 RepID=A0A370H3V8_9HYPH|nr:hypothetical protein [Microvirga subterranea]RDI50396.1 hypothetical protein DES45_12212 [Microvirga subterranea]
MDVLGDQLIVVVLLGAILAIGLALLLLLMLLAKRTWNWITGDRLQPHKREVQPSNAAPISGAASTAGITATDLFVIRSNLEAVSRQIEDLEHKLRQSAKTQANVVELRRK